MEEPSLFCFSILPFSFDARCGLFLFFTTDGRISLPPFPTFSFFFLFLYPLVSYIPSDLCYPFIPTYPIPFFSSSPIPHLSNFSLHPTSPTSSHFFYFCFPIFSCFKPSAASPLRLTPVTSCSKSVLSAQWQWQPEWRRAPGAPSPEHRPGHRPESSNQNPGPLFLILYSTPCCARTYVRTMAGLVRVSGRGQWLTTLQVPCAER